MLGENGIKLVSLGTNEIA